VLLFDNHLPVLTCSQFEHAWILECKFVEHVEVLVFAYFVKVSTYLDNIVVKDFSFLRI